MQAFILPATSMSEKTATFAFEMKTELERTLGLQPKHATTKQLKNHWNAEGNTCFSHTVS